MLSDVLHYFKDLQTINTSCCFLLLVQIGNFSGLPPSFSIDWQRGNQSAGRTDGAQVHFYPQANFGSIGTKSSIYLPIHKLKTVNIFTSLHLYSSTGFHFEDSHSRSTKHDKQWATIPHEGTTSASENLLHTYQRLIQSFNHKLKPPWTAWTRLYRPTFSIWMVSSQ